MKKIFLFLFLISSCSFGLSCGYSSRSALPSNLRTIYIEPIKNKINFTDENKRNIYFPLMEVNVRNAIVNRYLFDGIMRIAGPDKAALILKADLIGYDRQPLRYDDNENVLEYRIQISVDLTMTDIRRNEIAWEEKGFVGESSYFVTGASAKSENAALNDAMIDLAKRIVERTVEDW